jgi:hypothetical protein
MPRLQRFYRSTPVLLVTAAIIFTVFRVHADIAPTLDDCVEGSEGTSIDGHCYPIETCEDDAGSCSDALNSCLPVRYCATKLNSDDCSRPECNIGIEGFCSKMGDCAKGTCQTINVCVDKSQIPTYAIVSSSSSNGCSVTLRSSSRDNTSTLWLFGLVLAALCLRSRRNTVNHL